LKLGAALGYGQARGIGGVLDNASFRIELSDVGDHREQTGHHPRCNQDGHEDDDAAVIPT
jgi:hypothetical protein